LDTATNPVEDSLELWAVRQLNLKTTSARGAAGFAFLLALVSVCNFSCGGGSSGVSSGSPNIPPILTIAFGASTVHLNSSTSLTFKLENPNSGSSLQGIGFTDELPAGLAVATPNGMSGGCGGGSIAATAASTSISLSGALLNAADSCTFAVNVIGTSVGTQNNTISAVTASNSSNGTGASASVTVVGPSQQPPQPTDITPIGGESYYILNQGSGLQADLNSDSTIAGDNIVLEPRTFTDTSQRWIFTEVSSSLWQISNARNGLCLDSNTVSGVTYAVQNPCASSNTQQWTLTPTSNGYYTISDSGTGLDLDISSSSGGAFLDETPLSGSATQSQQWLLRPAFFRGVDNALLEKQEAARIAAGLPWWKDAGQQEDVLAILKNHGINMIRLRPSSVPPYTNISQSGCTGNACYGETDAQDLDLAKRAKNLGMSLELTLFFDGGNSASVPPAWANDTLSQLESDVYSYVRAEIIAYRQAGVMPDLVSIGNEVDTGFLGSLGSPTSTNFGPFAALQIQALQAVKDAAADTSIGPALPAPLTCIHITPAWDLTQFFTLANQNGIAYDAICQSYYPIYHGPLTDAQAAAANPGNKPVEQDVLVNAANNIGKPIFIIETGEHYESGFQSNDPWYAPPTPATQRQFLLDLQSVMENLPNNLGIGFEYWDATGVNIPNESGGFINGDNSADAIYVWNGLTLFDNADTSGSTDVNSGNYSELLPALDALGGKLREGVPLKVNVTRAPQTPLK
jgi:arabinogalactan endo-1,4-beta-galactosidase